MELYSLFIFLGGDGLLDCLTWQGGASIPFQYFSVGAVISNQNKHVLFKTFMVKSLYIYLHNDIKQVHMSLLCC